MLLATIDGGPAVESAIAAALEDAGFARGREGMLRRRMMERHA